MNDTTSDSGETNGLEGVGAPANLGPAKGGERIGSLDVIRGLAVMGILAANIVAFGQPFSAYMFPEAFLVPTGDPGGWQWVAQFVLIDGKMRGLFTLLFGAGLYLFMERAWSRGASRWLQARRLYFLLLFGVVHFFLIWRGDILMYYAMGGLIVLLMLRLAANSRSCPPKSRRAGWTPSRASTSRALPTSCEAGAASRGSTSARSESRAASS